MKDKFEHSIKESLENFEMPYNADAWAKMSAKLDAKSPTSGGSEAAGAAGAGATIGGLAGEVKSSLESFEMPYNPAAWDAMKAKLDAAKPVAGSNRNWYIGAAVVTGLVIGSYFMFFNDGENKVATETPIAQTNSEENTTTTTNKTTTEQNDVAQVPNNGTQADQQTTQISAASQNNTSNGASTQDSNGSQTPSDPASASDQHSTQGTPNTPSDNDGNTTTTDKPSTPPTNDMIIPTVSSMCQGESFEVDNANDAPLLVSGPDLYFIVPANEKRTVRTKQAGIHTIGALDTESQTPRVEFNVMDAPAADFLIDPSTKFENGLPTTKVASTVPGTQFDWVFNNQRVSGEEANAHFYWNGNHDITLTVTGSNGCKSSITKSTYVAENYNLMAMNSFRPNSTDPAVNTFMPYALKERDVQFTMIIFDPTDGHIIFETSDATRGWNGTDSKTGQMVPFEASYIWKVTIQNKEANEIRSEYSGQVIPVHSSK